MVEFISKNILGGLETNIPTPKGINMSTRIFRGRYTGTGRPSTLSRKGTRTLPDTVVPHSQRVPTIAFQGVDDRSLLSLNNRVSDLRSADFIPQVSRHGETLRRPVPGGNWKGRRPSSPGRRHKVPTRGRSRRQTCTVGEHTETEVEENPEEKNVPEPV